MEAKVTSDIEITPTDNNTTYYEFESTLGSVLVEVGYTKFSGFIRKEDGCHILFEGKHWLVESVDGSGTPSTSS